MGLIKTIKSFLYKPLPPKVYSIENAKQYETQIIHYAQVDNSGGFFDFMTKPLPPLESNNESAEAYEIMVKAHAKATAIRKGNFREEHKHIHFHQ